MLKLNKKCSIYALISLFGIAFLFFGLKPLLAASPRAYQVKLANSPVVYFLHYGSHHKKVYLNAKSYLSYNNKWSDVKIISAKELATWPDIQLMKTASLPSVFYVHGNQRAKINNRDDLESFGFLGEPILSVSEVDLLQYQLVSYQEIGLVPYDKGSEPKVTNSNTTNKPNTISSPTNIAIAANQASSTASSTKALSPAGSLLVYNDLVVVSDNTLVTNTSDNLMGVFRFKATQNIATVTSMTLTFSGLYNIALLSQATAKDENNNSYDINTNVRINDRQITINFREPLIINSGMERTVKVYVDFKTCDCNNQTIRLELKKASDINSNLTPNASWPLQGTLFKLFVAEGLLGNLTLQEESFTSPNSVSGVGKLIAKFTLSETTGKENILVKKLVLGNNGTANKNDLTNFSLLNNNQVISRVSDYNSSRDIVFNINYLRISKNASTVLTVKADLKTDYNKTATLDLKATELTSSGESYKLSSPAKINNLTEIITLN